MDVNTRGRRAIVLTTLSIAVSVVLLGTTILNVALPALHEELGASNSEQQWILNAYTLTFAGFLLVAGAIGDRFGLRRTLLVGMTGFAVTTLAAGFAPGAGLLIALRGAGGVFAAAIMPISLAIIVRAFPREHVAAAIAAWAAVSGVSIALGPLVGGALIDAGLWWGSVLVMVAAVTIVGLVMAVFTLPDPAASEDAATLRLTPVVYSIVGIGLLVWGIIHGGQDNQWASPQTVLPIIAGIGVLAVLVTTEARRSDALADVRLLADPKFAVAVVMLTLGTFTVYGFLYFSMFYIQVQRGFSPLMAGLMLLPMSAGLVMGGPTSRLVDLRIGTLATMASGMVLAAVAMGLFALLGTDTPMVVFMVLVWALAFGFSMVLAPGTTLAMSAVPPGRDGAGSALVNTLRQLGSVLGVAILGSVLWGSYRSGIEPHLTGVADHWAISASLSDTLAYAGSDAGLAGAAHESFTTAMQLTTLTGAAVTALAAASAPIAGIVLRKRRNTQAGQVPVSVR